MDDSSTDGSWEALLRMTRGRSNVRVERLKVRKTIGAVRALAVQLSKARLIANLDADCVPPPNWLSHCRLLSDSVGVIGFPVIPPSDMAYLDADSTTFEVGNVTSAAFPMDGVDGPAIRLQRKRTTLTQHLQRYYQMGQNASRGLGVHARLSFPTCPPVHIGVGDVCGRRLEPYSSHGTTRRGSHFAFFSPLNEP